MESNSANFLHDATLVSLTVDWCGKAAEVRFRRSGDRTTRLSALGLSYLAVPHREPWGPSVSVNQVREEIGTGPDNRHHVEIEMQSGDIIQIDASRIEWEKP
jgi:hypothetical protein